MTCILPGGLGQVGAFGPPSTWDPANTNGGVTLSNNNKSAAFKTGTSGLVRGTRSHTGSGKWYFEITVVNVAGNGSNLAGLCDSLYSITGGTYIGDSTDSFGLWPTAGSPYTVYGGMGTKGPSIGTSGANGDTLTFCVDMTGLNIYAGVNAPNTATSTWSLTSGLILYPACSVDGSGVQWTLTTGGAFKYAVPSGYSPWG